MADITAKREARRKRILENSASRLRKITSLHHDSVADDKPEHNLNTENSSPIINYSPLHTDNDEDQDNDEIDTHLISSNINLEKTTDTSKNVNSNRNWVIFFIVMVFKIISLLCMKLHLLEEYDLQINKIFMPFLLYEAMDIIVLKSSIKENSFFNTLLFLSNLPPRSTQNISRVINILATVMQDMFFYLFIFLTAEVCLFTCLGI